MYKKYGGDSEICADVLCASEVADKLDCRFALVSKLFVQQGRAHDVSVGFVDADGQNFSAQTAVSNGTTQAVRAALAEAYAKLEQGPGPWLAVTGLPIGASVYFDDVFVGQLPLERTKVAPGIHRLRVELAGYQPHEQSVELGVETSAETKLQVNLQAGAASSSDHAGNPFRFWGGIGLGVTGAVVAGVAIAYAVQDDRCLVADSAGTCHLKEGADGGRVAAVGVAGGVLFSVGIGLVIWDLLDRGDGSKPSAKKAQAKLSLGPASLALTGRF